MKPTAIALHIGCLLRKLGTGKPLAPHVQGILRELRKLSAFHQPTTTDTNQHL